MRRLAWAVLLGAGLLVAGIAFWLHAPWAVQRVMLVAPRPAAVPTPPVQAVEVAESRVSVLARVRLSAIAALIERELPGRFSGVEEDPTGLLFDDRLNWSLTRGEVMLTEVGGQLRVRIPIQDGEAFVRGRIGGRRLSVPVEARLRQVRGELLATFYPRMRSDWVLLASPRLALDLERAELDLGEVGSFSVRREIEYALRRKQRDIEARIAAVLGREQMFRKSMQRLWEAAFLVRRLDAEGLAQLRVAPTSVAASEVRLDGDYLVARLGVTGRTELSFGITADPPQRQPLPSLGRLTEEDSRVLLNLPVVIDLPSVGQQLTRRLSGTGIDVAGQRLRLGTVAAEAAGDQISLRLSLSLETGYWRRQRQDLELSLSGRPELDRQTGRLHFADLRYDVPSADLLTRHAAALLEPVVMADLRARLALDLAEIQQKAGDQARAVIAEFRAGLPEGVDAAIELRSIRLVDVRVTSRHLLAITEAVGGVELTIDAL